MKTAFYILFTVLIALILSTTVLSKSNQKTWRCRKNVIEIGDSKGTVLFKCGPATVKDVTETTTEGEFTSETRAMNLKVNM